MADPSDIPSQSRSPLSLSGDPLTVNNRTSEEADRIRKEAALLFAELFYRQVMEARRARAKQKEQKDKKLDNGSAQLQ